MQSIEIWLGQLADAIWGSWLLIVLVGVGFYYTVMTGFIQFRRIPEVVSVVLRSKRKSTSKSISSLEALYTAVASIVGSGNIVGVSTAILAGGPGALFWMWFAAILGMATKFGEIVLGVHFRTKDAHGMNIGGPMYYIANGMKLPWLGILFALLLFVQNSGGTLIQTNTIVTLIFNDFSINPLYTGLVLAVLMSYIFLGGMKRLAKFATVLAPFMAILYISGGLLVIIANYQSIIPVFESIFKGAFSFKAGLGGAIGYSMQRAMRFGVARGLYSNEAGEGSSAVIHSCADVDHPVKQGLFGIVDVFIDTIVICTITGLVVLTSGVYLTHDIPATLAANAFGTVFPEMKYLVTVSLILFAGTSLMSQWHFGNVSLSYIVGEKAAGIYRIIFPVAIIVGSLSSSNLVWLIQDVALGILILPNLLALIVLSPLVRTLLRDYFGPRSLTTKQLFYEEQNDS